MIQGLKNLFFSCFFMKKFFLFFAAGVFVSLIIIGSFFVRNFRTPSFGVKPGVEKTEQKNEQRLPPEAQGEVILKISNMEANMKIENPLTVLGEAPGNWFFEGSFAVKVVDANLKLLGQGNAVAKGEWTTASFVPFEAKISFEKSSTKTGFVIFEKSNPSGLPEKAEEYKLPIRF